MTSAFTCMKNPRSPRALNGCALQLAPQLVTPLHAPKALERLLAVAPTVLWPEVIVQGLIAGAGTLYTYSKMVALLGPARAAVFPALAPGIAAFLAWPVLGHVPTDIEAAGLLIAVTGLLITVTAGRSTRPS